MILTHKRVGPLVSGEVKHKGKVALVF